MKMIVVWCRCDILRPMCNERYNCRRINHARREAMKSACLLVNETECEGIQNIPNLMQF